MTACANFRNALYFREEKCLAGIDNQGKLDYWPCIIYGRGCCHEHTTGEPKVKAADMPNHTPGFDQFNDQQSEF